MVFALRRRETHSDIESDGGRANGGQKEFHTEGTEEADGGHRGVRSPAGSFRCVLRAVSARKLQGTGGLRGMTGLWQSQPVIDALVFIFGLMFGSFLNVCIRRLPRHESIVTPGSHCPRCPTPIRARDNIPVVSYLLLRGRCRACRERISPEYALVELLTGLLVLGCYWQFGITLAGVKWTLFSAMMLVLVFTDFHERLLPNRVNYFGLAAGVAFRPFPPGPSPGGCCPLKPTSERSPARS